MVILSVWAVIKDQWQWWVAIRRLLYGEADPNDQRQLRKRAEGLCYTPLTPDGHRRMGTRERLKDVAARYPELLRIELNALATKVIFDSEKRAIGVEYLKGERLYRAHDKPSSERGERREIRASREVILAGGAFNTPQLLMLSGVGPKEVLEEHKIEAVHELAGVGQNLQDRYEVAIIQQMTKNFESLKGANFKSGDRLYREWLGRPISKYLPAGWQSVNRAGMYISNGATIAFTRRSPAKLPTPIYFAWRCLLSSKAIVLGILGRFARPMTFPGIVIV